MEEYLSLGWSDTRNLDTKFTHPLRESREQ